LRKKEKKEREGRKERGKEERGEDATNKINFRGQSQL